MEASFLCGRAAPMTGQPLGLASAPRLSCLDGPRPGLPAGSSGKRPSLFPLHIIIFRLSLALLRRSRVALRASLASATERKLYNIGVGPSPLRVSGGPSRGSLSDRPSPAPAPCSSSGPRREAPLPCGRGASRLRSSSFGVVAAPRLLAAVADVRRPPCRLTAEARREKSPRRPKSPFFSAGQPSRL